MRVSYAMDGFLRVRISKFVERMSKISECERKKMSECAISVKKIQILLCPTPSVQHPGEQIWTNINDTP